MSAERPKSFGCEDPPLSDQPRILKLRIRQIGIWGQIVALQCKHFLANAIILTCHLVCLVHGVTLEEVNVYF